MATQKNNPISAPAPTTPKVQAPIPQQVHPAPVPLPEILLQKFCLAIETFEGYIAPNKQYPEGSTSYRFNNPGNLVFAGQPGAVPATVEMPNGPHTFAHFGTYEEGFTALEAQILAVGKGTSETYRTAAHAKFGLASSAMLTVLQFFQIYSPSSDDNDPNHYANWVGNDIGIDPSTTTMQHIVA